MVICHMGFFHDAIIWMRYFSTVELFVLRLVFHILSVTEPIGDWGPTFISIVEVRHIEIVLNNWILPDFS